MNTGILLKIPGESPYSKFRRYLIANSGVIKSRSDLKESLIRLEKSRSSYPQTDKGNEFFDMYEMANKVSKIENVLFSSCASKSDHRKILYGYGPTRHCQKCTEAYFHSMLFELPWIKKCPVHHIRLTNSCEECGQPLSRITKLLNNFCKSCGCTGNLSRAMKKRAENDFSIFGFSSQLEEIDRYRYPYVEYRTRDNRIENGFINNNSWFYPHVIYKNNEKEKNKLGYLSITSPALKSYEYIAEYNWPLHANDLIRHHTVIQCFIEITEKIIKALKKKMKHKIGDCFSKKPCHYCDSFELWIRYIPREVKQIFQYVSPRSFNYGTISDLITNRLSVVAQT
ncbi:hypothetical protein [Aliikangiella sp. IMCC44359]|uniref:hypothetical protein n=1 Tax=Aliikangiella sp. IMCC44359 TaxID=3459125 RepID=UPI00403B03C2